MKKRSRAYTRYQRQRTIQRKWSILKNVLQYEEQMMPPRGKLNKGKIHCSCIMCKCDKYFDILKPQYESKLLAMQQEIQRNK